VDVMVRHQPSGLYYLAKVAETNSKGVSVEYPGWEGEAELLRWNTDRVEHHDRSPKAFKKKWKYEGEGAWAMKNSKTLGVTIATAQRKKPAGSKPVGGSTGAPAGQEPSSKKKKTEAPAAELASERGAQGPTQKSASAGSTPLADSPPTLAEPSPTQDLATLTKTSRTLAGPKGDPASAALAKTRLKSRGPSPGSRGPSPGSRGPSPATEPPSGSKSSPVLVGGYYPELGYDVCGYASCCMLAYGHTGVHLLDENFGRSKRRKVGPHGNSEGVPIEASDRKVSPTYDGEISAK